jgi:hypothetical protein
MPVDYAGSFTASLPTGEELTLDVINECQPGGPWRLRIQWRGIRTRHHEYDVKSGISEFVFDTPDGVSITAVSDDPRRLDLLGIPTSQ